MARLNMRFRRASSRFTVDPENLFLPKKLEAFEVSGKDFH
jgi:hypothetical protein